MKHIHQYYLLLIIMTSAQVANAGQWRIFNQERDDAWMPATYLVNGTFDVTQNQYWFSQEKFGEKFDLLVKRLRHPDRSINADGGFDKLFEDEFMTGRVMPNIFLHAFGGAYDNIWLEEYYRYYGFEHSFLLAVATSYLARVGNEALETSQARITSHDHIADLFFFDVVGVVMAAYPRAQDFVLNDLGMKAWHFQPMWDVRHDNFTNAGLNYLIRPYFMREYSCVSPMILMGMQNLVGASYTCHGEDVYSAAVGLFLTDPLEQKSRLVTGLFYERQQELAASLLINGSDNFRWRVNLHPPLTLHLLRRPIKLGVLLGETYQDAGVIGLNVNMPLGLSMSTR